MKPEIGKLNLLTVARIADAGIYFDGGSLGEILLPKRQLSQVFKVGDSAPLFVYPDGKQGLMASLQIPRAMVGEFAMLKVVAVNEVGAFLDWGLPKELLVPFREQQQKMMEGRFYIVRVYVDEKTQRIAASSRIDRFLDQAPPAYTPGEEVDLLICRHGALGYAAIVNDAHWGMLFENEIFQEIARGERLSGYVRQVREDGKIDLTLQKPGYEKVGGVAQDILDKLAAAGGFIPVTDRSAPQDIYQRFAISKKTYKKAVGALYKQRRITIDADGIRLIDKSG